MVAGWALAQAPPRALAKAPGVAMASLAGACVAALALLTVASAGWAHALGIAALLAVALIAARWAVPVALNPTLERPERS